MCALQATSCAQVPTSTFGPSFLGRDDRKRAEHHLVEPADPEKAAVAASAPAAEDAAASAPAASCADTLGGTHRWWSGLVLLALLLALVLEPIGAVVVDTEHLAISGILCTSTTPSANTTGATSGAKSVCAGNSSPSCALRTEPASFPSSDKAAPTQPTTEWRTSATFAEALFDFEVLRCKYLHRQPSVLGSQQHECDQRRKVSLVMKHITKTLGRENGRSSCLRVLVSMFVLVSALRFAALGHAC